MATRKSVPDHEREIIPVVEESLELKKRTAETGKLRVTRAARQRQVHIDEPLAYEEVDVERVPVNRVVTAIPSVRREGDTTIIPVLEEEIVIEKRLILREEIRVTKRREVRRFVDDVPAAIDEVKIERDDHREDMT